MNNTSFHSEILLDFKGNTKQLEKSLAALKSHVNTLLPKMEQLSILFASIGQETQATILKNFAKNLADISKETKFNKQNIDESIKALQKLAQTVAYSESVFKSLRKDLQSQNVKSHLKDYLKLQEAYDKLKFNLEQLIETQEKWASSKTIKAAKEYVKDVLEEEEKRISKLILKYNRLLMEREKALAEGDINKLNKVHAAIAKRNSLLKQEIDAFKTYETKVKNISIELKKVDSIAWFKEISKRAVAYASVYASIYGLIQVLKNAVTYISEVDLTTRRLQAILSLTSVSAGQLEHSFLSLAKTFGGSLEEINKAALDLGRAGIDPSQVKEATKVVVELAMLTGDSYEAATNTIVTFKENYEEMIKAVYKGIDPIVVLGNKIAYIANASRMSVEDISTFANYALATAKSVGLTVDMVGALAIALNNAGNNASTVGTEIRRFATLLVTNKAKIREFFDAIGINQKILISKLQKGGKEAEEAFLQVIKRLQELNNTDFNNLIGQLQVLDRQTLAALRNTSSEVINQFFKLKKVSTDGLQEASVIAESYVNIWQRFKNLLGELALKFDAIVKAGANAIAGFMELFADDKTKKLIALSEKYKKLIELKKYYENIHYHGRVEQINKEIEALGVKIKSLKREKEEVLSLAQAYELVQKMHNMNYYQADMLKKNFIENPAKTLNWLFSDSALYDWSGLGIKNTKILRDELLRIIATNKQLGRQLLNNKELAESVKQKLREYLTATNQVATKQLSYKQAINFVTDSEINKAQKLIALAKQQINLHMIDKKEIVELNSILDKFINRQQKAISKYLTEIKEVSKHFKTSLYEDVKSKDPLKASTELQKILTTGVFKGKSLNKEELIVVEKLYSFYQKIVKLEQLRLRLHEKQKSARHTRSTIKNTKNNDLALYQQIHNLYINVLPDNEKIKEWYQQQLKKVNQIQDVLLRQKALNELNLVYESKKVEILNKQNKAYDNLYKKAQKAYKEIQKALTPTDLYGAQAKAYEIKKKAIEAGFSGEKLKQALKDLDAWNTRQLEKIEQKQLGFDDNTYKAYKDLAKSFGKESAKNFASALMIFMNSNDFNSFFTGVSKHLAKNYGKEGAIAGFLVTNTQKLLSTLFENQYNLIRKHYQPHIDMYNKQSRDEQFRSKVYTLFGYEGFGQLAKLKSDLKDFYAKKETYLQNYELMKRSKKYKENIQTALETGSIAAGFTASAWFDGGAVLQGLNMAMNAQKWADEATGFTTFQKEFVQSVENMKQALQTFVDDLVDLANSIYKNIDDYRNIYDEITGTNTYALQRRKEAIEEVKKYTDDLSKNGLTELVQNILAQSKKAVESIIATTQDINKLTDFKNLNKYGIAVDALNSKLKESIQIVSKLITQQNKANISLTKYIVTLKKGIGEDTSSDEITLQADAAKAIQEYEKGSISYDELLNRVKAYQEAAGIKANDKIITALENIKQMSTKDYLKAIMENTSNAIALPDAQVEALQDPELKTLEVIKDTRNLVEKLLGFLTTTLNSQMTDIVNILFPMLDITRAILDTLRGFFGWFKPLFLGLNNIGGKITSTLSTMLSTFSGKFDDLLKTVVQSAIGIIKNSLSTLQGGLANIGGNVLALTGHIVTNAIKNVHSLTHSVTHGIHRVFHKFGFAEGGYTGAGTYKDATGEKVAGVVHENEWVAPKWMLKRYPELFKWLENGRINGNLQIPTIVTQPVQVNLMSYELSIKELQTTNTLLKEQLIVQQKMHRLLQKIEEEGINVLS